MKKIKDERLIIKNLKHTRIGFLTLYLGSVGILVYEAIKNGVSSMTSQPLWFVLMVTTTVMLYLQLSISVEHEKPEKQAKPSSYYKVLLLALGIAIAAGFLLTLNQENGMKEWGIISGAVFLCIIAPYSVIYYLRRKRSEDSE